MSGYDAWIAELAATPGEWKRNPRRFNTESQREVRALERAYGGNLTCLLHAADYGVWYLYGKWAEPEA